MLKYNVISANFDCNFNILKYPYEIYFKVTCACNYNCEFCSQNGGANFEMNFEDAKKWLKEFRERGAIKIYYTGGEPLMYSNLYKLLQYGKELKLKQIIITNGYLLKKNSVLDYIDGLGISLHGTATTHDNLVGVKNAHNQVVANLKWVKENYPQIGISLNYTVSELNFDYKNMKSVADISKQYNTELHIARINYIGRGEPKKIQDVNKLCEFVDNLRSQNYKVKISNCIIPCVVEKKYDYLTHGCGAGITTCAVEANGDVKICASSSLVLGNLHNDTFDTIWNNILKWKQDPKITLICQTCKKFLQCRGGCRSEINNDFRNQVCDALLINKMQKIWSTLKDKKLKYKYNQIIWQGEDIILPNPYPRIINKNSLKVIKLLDGKLTGIEIQKQLKLDINEEDIRELLITLFIDDCIL